MIKLSKRDLKSYKDIDLQKLVLAVQAEYDAWDENEDEYFGGGICHLLADKIIDELSNQGIESSSVSQQCGEVHVFVLARLSEGVVSIDINPYRYETGAGYNWQKIQDVKFDTGDIAMDVVSQDPNDFEEYTGDGW